MSDTNNMERLHNFDLASFRKAQDAMIATSSNSYGSYRGHEYRDRVRDYTEEEVKKIIESGSLFAQQALSRNYFKKDGFYKQLILHYATLLKYIGILIPNPTPGKSLSTSHISKRYFQALDFVDKMNLQTVLVDWAQKILVNGCYYGILVNNDKLNFCVLDLPVAYCTTRFKDYAGNDIIEFDVSYFNSLDKDSKKAALAAYPDFIVKAYRRWNVGKLKSKWVVIPSDIGICFPMFDGCPFFIHVIPSIIKYGETVETEQERDKEEIRKVIVQKIPHLTDGRLLFEPDEAVEIHNGAVGMVRNNKNTSVLTTYADVDAIVSKASSENSGTVLEKMQQNIYSQAGISSEIFAATGGNTTETSLNFDTAVMMNLANKFAKFVTNIVNVEFANSNINFKYTILPITHHNETKYIDNSYKLATAGYSLIVPALAQGFTQRDLVNVKDLENDVLKLTEKLIPPQTAFTQDGESGGNGRPTKETGEKKDKTLENEKSIEKSKTQGGSE